MSEISYLLDKPKISLGVGQKTWTEPTDDELDIQIAKAKEEAVKAFLIGPKAKAIRFSPICDTVNLLLTSGVRIKFPKTLVSELADASEEGILDYEIVNFGDDIHWSVLDFHIHTEDLIKCVISQV